MLTRKFSVCNLAANWYVPLSALVLFVVQEEFILTGYAEAIVAFLVLCVLCGCVTRSELWSVSRSSGVGLKVYSWLTALGVCSFSPVFLYERMLKHPERLAKLLAMTHLPAWSVYYVVLAVSLLGMVFVYLWTNYFLHKFMKLTESRGLFMDISRAEKAAYTVIFAASVVFVTVVFAKTGVFYGHDITYDIIYTSDSGIIVGRNAFLNIPHYENDIRQPLFAVFALPFMGVPYLFGRIAALFAGHGEFMTALFMNYVQIAMLLAGVFLLTKAMKLSPSYRLIFPVIFSCSYMYLLAILNMEQYIVAFFWLMLCVYLACNDSEPDSLALYGATGTLTTGIALAPFYLGGAGGKLRRLLRMAVEFAALMLIFSRSGLIYHLFSRLTSLFRFTGVGSNPLPFTSRFAQYSEFVYYSFFSPNAGVQIGDNISWQLNPVISINYIGLAILAVSILGAIISRNSRICRIAFMWVVYSFVILCALGWGTSENGLILYALYFSWAFYVLVFMLAMRVRVLVPVIAAVAVYVLARVSLPAIVKVVEFGVKYYPFTW